MGMGSMSPSPCVHEVFVAFSSVYSDPLGLVLSTVRQAWICGVNFRDATLAVTRLPRSLVLGPPAKGGGVPFARSLGPFIPDIATTPLFFSLRRSQTIQRYLCIFDRKAK